MTSNPDASGPAPAATDERAAIAAANQKFMTAFQDQDAATVAALYTTEALLLPPHADIVSGRQAIQGFWTAVMHSGIREVQLETVDLERYGSVLEEVGKYTLLGAAGNVLDKGKYLVIWEREGTQWQLHRDIFNTSLPAN